MPKQTKHKSFTKMTAQELSDATRQFDAAPLPDSAGRSMTAKERGQWRRLKRGRGRPTQGKGAVNVLISFERGRLERADELARSLGVGRSRLSAMLIDACIEGESGRKLFPQSPTPIAPPLATNRRKTA